MREQLEIFIGAARKRSEALDHVRGLGGFEVVDTLAARIPAELTCHLLGWPRDRWRDVRSWSERLMRVDSLHRDPLLMSDAIRASQEIATLTAATVPPRRGADTGDVLRQGRATHPEGTEVHPGAWWSALRAAITDAGGLGDVAAWAIGIAGPTDVLGALAIGIAAAGLTLVVVGSPAGHPNVPQVAESLARMGIHVTGLRLAENQPWGARILLAESVDRRPLLIKVYGRDAWDSQLLAKGWRALWYRETDALTLTRLQQAEHEAFFRRMLGPVEEPTLPFGLVDVQGRGTGIDESIVPLPDDLSRRIRAQARAHRGRQPFLLVGLQQHGEPPRLAVVRGGRKARRVEQPLDRARRQRLRPVAADRAALTDPIGD